MAELGGEGLEVLVLIEVSNKSDLKAKNATATGTTGLANLKAQGKLLEDKTIEKIESYFLKSFVC